MPWSPCRRLWGEAGDLEFFLADNAGGNPEGGVAPVALGGQLSRRAVLLSAGDKPSVFDCFNADTEAGKYLQRHIHVPLGLQRGGEQDAAVTL